MPDALTHEEIERRLEALFGGEPLREPLRVREHLRGCARCRAWFNELSEIEAALGGGEAPADGFAARYSAAVVEASAAPPGWTAQLKAALWPQARGWGAAAATTCAALALLALWRPWASPDEGFQPRSGDARPQAARDGVWQLDAFCVRHAPGHAPRFLARAEPHGPLRCAPDDELKLAYLNHAARGEPYGWIAVASRGEDGELWWHLPLAPASEGSPSMPIQGADRLQPLGQTLRLELRHAAPARRELIALFSASPLPRAAAEAALRRGAPEGALGLGDVRLRSLRLQIEQEAP
jgi:hypothetical protein